MNELIYKVCQWADEKGITEKSDTSHQLDKTLEEMQELLKAMREDNIDEIKDAIGDIAVTLIIGYYLTVKDKDVVVRDMTFKYTYFNLSKADYDFIRDRAFLKYADICSSFYQYIDIYTEKNRGYLALLDALANKYSTTLENCLETVLGVITKRQGKMIDGVFVKNA